MRDKDQKLLWESYIKESDFTAHGMAGSGLGPDLSDVHYSGDEDVHDMAKIEPQELGLGELEHDHHEPDLADLLAALNDWVDDKIERLDEYEGEDRHELEQAVHQAVDNLRSLMDKESEDLHDQIKIGGGNPDDQDDLADQIKIG